MNKIFLDGNVGGDPELKRFDSGQQVSKFSLAVNEGYKNKAGEWENKTLWVDVVSWGKSAEFVEKNLSKGQKIVVEGKLSIRSYDDKDGNKRYVTEVVSNSFTTFTKRESTAFQGIENTSNFVDVDTPAKTNFSEDTGEKLQAGDLDDLPF